MGRQTVQTLLSIDEWAQIMGVSPWEFNQVGQGFPNNVVMPCENVWFQHQWQKDFIAREEIAQAIYDAEYMLAQQAGFFFAPKFVVSEGSTYPTTRDLWRVRDGRGVYGMWRELNLDYGHFITGGIFARTVLSDVSITYSDADGDGIEDTFTVSFATTVTDPSEIALYNVSGDRMGQALDEAFRIRPINVSIASGTCTVTGHKALCIKPSLTEIVDPQILDVTLASNFITEMTPARVYIDQAHTTTTPYHGVAIWNPPPDCVADNCTESSRAVCIVPVVPDQGLVRVQMDAVSTRWPYGWEPDRLSLNYVAGRPLINGHMHRELAIIVARLATAFLPNDKCGCERAQRIIHYWRAKVSEPGEGEDRGRAFTPEEIDSNPFGEPRVGALYAWKRVRAMTQVRSVSVY